MKKIRSVVELEIKIEFTDIVINLKCADNRQSITDMYLLIGVILAKFREWKHGSPKITEKVESKKPLK